MLNGIWNNPCIFIVAFSLALDFRRISTLPYKKEILAPFYIKWERLTRLTYNFGIYKTNSKMALAEFGNQTVIALILYIDKVNVFP